MKTVPLKANLRDQVGKQQVKKIRSHKGIPAVVYGHGIKATPIEVAQDDFLRVIHTKAGENVIIHLSVEGEKKFEKTVVIKEIQHSPTTDAIQHVDFNVISMTEQIKVKVPLHVKGDAPGVKEGGVLDLVHHEIEVECLPTQIPERLDIDISTLQIGDAIHLRELAIPQGVVAQLPADEVIVTIHAPKAEEEVAPAEEAGAAEPEVIGKKKEEEGEEGEAVKAPSPAPKQEKAGEKGEKKEKS